MEFFIIELLLLSSIGSVALMALGLMDGASDIRIPNLNRFDSRTPSTGRAAVPINEGQELHRFDEAA